jgi:hypothetical protein
MSVKPRYLRNRAATIRAGFPAWTHTAELLEKSADEIERLRALVPEQDGASEALGEPKASEHPSPNAREAAERLIEGYANRKKRTDFEDDALTVAHALLSGE